MHSIDFINKFPQAEQKGPQVYMEFFQWVEMDSYHDYDPYMFVSDKVIFLLYVDACIWFTK